MGDADYPQAATIIIVGIAIEILILILVDMGIKIGIDPFVPVAHQGGRPIDDAPDGFDVLLGVVGVGGVLLPDVLVVDVGLPVPLPEPAFPEPDVDRGGGKRRRRN